MDHRARRAPRGNPPVPTADRLHTVITLAQESGLIQI
jgi:hypothetical protein